MMAPPRTCECMTCPKCREREWARARHRLIAYGQWHPKGDLEAVRAHLDQLRASGLGIQSIATKSGVSRAAIYGIVRGAATWVSTRNAARLLAVTPDDHLRLPIGPIARRLQALSAIGWTTYALAAELGTAQTNVARLMRGEGSWVLTPTDTAVRALYDRLCMTPGGSQHAVRNARAKGYRSPLWWDDIDTDPEPPRAPSPARDGYDAAVVERILGGDWRLSATAEERTAVCERWVAGGRSLADLVKLTGWKADRYYRVGAA